MNDPSLPKQQLIEQLKSAAANDPSLMKQFVNWVLSDDSDPVKKDEHPLFWNSSKNPNISYQPTNGFGIQKDGTKFHGFAYNCVANGRTESLFGEQIEAIKKSVTEATKTESCDLDGSEELKRYISVNPAIDVGSVDSDAKKNVSNLASVLVTAYTDLILNANEDMKSYLFLKDYAVYALSDEVKEIINDLKHDGGVALALVTELVATGSAESLFKRAVLPRSNEELSGIEALNESYAVKVYSAIIPSFQTRGLLLNNGIQVEMTNEDHWTRQLIDAAPCLDALLGMKFDTIEDILEGQEETPNSNSASSLQTRFVEEMYAGLVDSSFSVPVPPCRRYLIANGVGMKQALVMENHGHYNLASMDDKEIHQVVSSIIEQEDVEKNERKAMSCLLSKFMTARQSEQQDFEFELRGEASFSYGRQDLRLPGGRWITQGPKRRPISSFGNMVRKTSSASASAKFGARFGAKLGFSKLAGGAAKLGAAKLGAAGLGAAGASGALAAAGGPVGTAIALAPLLMEIAADNEQRVNANMVENAFERKQISGEVNELLQLVKDLSTEEDEKRQKELAGELLDKVQRPESFAFQKLRGMDLQNELEAWSTRFSPLDMAALPPYESDAALVAAVDSGRVLSALALFVFPGDHVKRPDRKLLQQPKYVSMMGVSEPFQTKTFRSTSERQTMSFVNESSSSGFSTAMKSTMSSSGSMQGKLSMGLASGKAKASGGVASENKKNNSYANDRQHKEEEKQRVTQAVVTEFTYMPMKSVKLVEGGLILSDYAYHRLQKIFPPEGLDTAPEITCASEESRYKAREFLKNFGSHIPFGTQTLGGVFIRKMVVTTAEKESLVEMYAAASSKLSEANAFAMSAQTEASGRKGMFGLGGSASSSQKHSLASSRETTKCYRMAKGEGTGTNEMTANFSSDVLCFGPNAATQDEMYQQLMTNNATWSVIDRGEPESYLAIWDLIDYLGQKNGIFDKECELLRKEWEEMALSNDISENCELLSMVMRGYDKKKALFSFVMGLISSLVPNKRFNYHQIAEQFETVVKAARPGNKDTDDEKCEDAGAARNSTNVGIDHLNSPTKFIRKGFKLAGINANDQSFELAERTSGWKMAETAMLGLSETDWKNHFTYYGAFQTAILELAKPFQFLEMCKSAFESDNSYDWIRINKILSDASGYVTREKLEFRDEESLWHPLHYSMFYGQQDIVKKLYDKYPRAAYATDRENRNIIRYILDTYNSSNAIDRIKDYCQRITPTDDWDFANPYLDLGKNCVLNSCKLDYKLGQMCLHVPKKATSLFCRPTTQLNGDYTWVFGICMDTLRSGNHIPRRPFAALYQNEPSDTADHFMQYEIDGTIIRPHFGLDYKRALPNHTRWIQFVAVSANGSFKSYVNGIEIRTGSFATPQPVGGIGIGNSFKTGSGNEYEMWIKDIKLFDRSLDDKEIRALWESFYYEMYSMEAPPSKGSVNEHLKEDFFLSY